MKNAIIIISIVLNLFLGWLRLETYCYERGVKNGVSGVESKIISQIKSRGTLYFRVDGETMKLVVTESDPNWSSVKR